MPTTLSIITISYNNLTGLTKTIESIDYSLSNIVHNIVDGGSSDGTVEFLKSSELPLNWVSEKDDGIYHAMNKGIDLSNSNYLIFMNSGDTFYRKNVLTSILSILEKHEPDVLYGRTMCLDEEYNDIGIRSKIMRRSFPLKLTWKSFKMGMPVCHQSFIIKREIAHKYVENNLVADIDWMIKSLKKAQKVELFDGIIAGFLMGGTSQTRRIRSLVDRWKVLVKHYGLTETLKSHMLILFRQSFSRISSFLRYFGIY